MSDAVRHRGPDTDGICIENAGSGGVWAGLSHRRLSILDLSTAGAQPMVSHSGRYVIAYNGEIYNYLELRADLEADGVQGWRSHSDTEVLLEGVARYGVAETLARVDGMFAFALLDRELRTVTLARDAFGEKPLVYGFWGGVLLFGSELGSFRAWPGFAPDEDAEALSALMQYGCIPVPLTIYRGVRKLPPAHLVRISLSDIQRAEFRQPMPWWDMIGSALASRTKRFDGDFESAVDAVELAFSRSISRRMVSDVPIGALLSGGIDSTLTTVFMQRASCAPVRTFTIGMDEAGYDESPHAEAVASHLGTDHETLRLSASDVLEEVPRIASRYDEPFADSSQLPTYLVSCMARRHVTVALSGDGGDELFAGYNRHFHGPRVWSKIHGVPIGLRSWASRVLGSLPAGLLETLVRLAGPLAPRDLAAGRAGEKLHKLARILGARDRDLFWDALLRTGRAEAVLAPEAMASPDVFGEDMRLVGLDFASVMMLLDTGRYLHDDVLTKIDRASMAVGLETRTPFLERKLFELAWRLPHLFKADGGEGKRVLRALLYRHVPREIVDRPKAGFATPIGRWLRGPLSGWAEDLLSGSALAQSGFFDVSKVRGLWQLHRTGKCDFETQLWNVLMYQSWYLLREK